MKMNSRLLGVIPEKDISLVAGFSDYLINGPKEHSNDTVRTYQQHFFTFLRHLPRKQGIIESVSRANLNAVLVKIPHGMASTRNNLVWSVKSFARYLESMELISKETLDGVLSIKLSRKHKPKRNYLKNDLIEDIIVSILKSQNYNEMERLTNISIFSTLSFTGLRSSELCNLRIEDIDFENGKIVVISGKGGKTRVIGLPNKIVPLLKLYLGNRPESKYSNFFLGSKGSPLNRDLVGKRFSRISKTTEISVSPHTLRRSFATDVVQNRGVSLDKLQIVLGHSDIITTRNYVQTRTDDVALEMRGW